jgi:DNA topoisomerase-3
MQVILCEKPSQARDIARVLGADRQGDGCLLGNDVAVTWCFGHLIGLAPPEAYDASLSIWSLEKLPVLPSAWQTVVKGDAAKQLGLIGKLLKSASEVVVATDADREGEMIGREVLDRHGWRGKVSRLWLSALDDASIRKALSNILPGEKTQALYYAGMARSRADWLTGMNLTIAYTVTHGSGKGAAGVVSVGRVQTPTLALIVARDREIEIFKPKSYFVVSATFQASEAVIPGGWIPPENLADEEGRCLSKAAAQAVVDKVTGKTGRVALTETTPSKDAAPLPFDLATLQQEASRRWGMGAAETLACAQALYETHKATTYPRTDCPYLPTSQFADASRVLAAIRRAHPDVAAVLDKADPAMRSRAWNDSKITAHHAIIPIANDRVNLHGMKPAERRIYDLVVRHYLAQFLGDHEYLKQKIEVICEGEVFRTHGRTPTKPGWKLAFSTVADDAEKAEQEPVLPRVTQGEKVPCLQAEMVAKKTQPPARYTEGTLIAAMKNVGRNVTDPVLKSVLKETAGIGTEATRAAIIKNLFVREYIRPEKKKWLASTDKGRHLIDILPSALTDPATTARWEQALEEVACGRARMEDFLELQTEFVSGLVTKLKAENVGGARRGREVGTNPTSGGKIPLPVDGPIYPCPTCHQPLVRRQGKNGWFWGCSTYPQCRGTLPDDSGKPGLPPPENVRAERHTQPPREHSAAGTAGEKCPTCGAGTLVLRSKDSRPFLGCTGYPACRHFNWIKA